MWLSDPTQVIPGDVAFYKGDVNKPIDHIIMARTKSEIVHVAVVTDGLEANARTIAAVSEGIRYEVLGTPYRTWRPVGGYGRLEEGLAFLRSQVGQVYGFADIANQVLLLTGKDPVLLDKSEDCSDLATKFLWVAGVALPYQLIDTNRVTPGWLATILDSVS